MRYLKPICSTAISTPHKIRVALDEFTFEVWWHKSGYRHVVLRTLPKGYHDYAFIIIEDSDIQQFCKCNVSLQDIKNLAVSYDEGNVEIFDAIIECIICQTVKNQYLGSLLLKPLAYSVQIGNPPVEAYFNSKEEYKEYCDIYM
jgi:hypothetical protein